MREYKLTEAEAKFAGILWESVPIKSPELVTKCGDELNWKKSTTYTMLRRLEQKQIFINNGGTVEALLTKADFCAAQSKHYVDEAFGGSLPRFLAAFTRQKALSNAEIDELQRMIDEHREG